MCGSMVCYVRSMQETQYKTQKHEQPAPNICLHRKGTRTTRRDIGLASPRRRTMTQMEDTNHQTKRTLTTTPQTTPKLPLLKNHLIVSLPHPRRVKVRFRHEQRGLAESAAGAVIGETELGEDAVPDGFLGVPGGEKSLWCAMRQCWDCFGGFGGFDVPSRKVCDRPDRHNPQSRRSSRRPRPSCPSSSPAHSG